MTIQLHHDPLPLYEWQDLFNNNQDRPYYSVLGKRFDNKLMAIRAATESVNITGHSPYYVLRWHAFESLNTYDFSQEPQETYRELCKQRALQLREKYDYIRLYYSGGPDSHTTLRAFYEANVSPDEIVIIRNTTIGIDAPSNIENTKLTIPSINKILAWFPKIKINVQEYVLDTNNQYESVDRTLSRMLKATIPSPITRTMANAFDLDKTMLLPYSKGTVCELTGEPKPCLVKKNGKWWAYIVDNQIDTSLLLPNLEMFHLSSDFPQLFCKQSHMLRRQYVNLMVGQPDNYSMNIDTDFDEKNKFLERYNEWDTENYIILAHKYQKFRDKNGNYGTTIWAMNNMKNNTQFYKYMKWMQEFWKKEIFNQNKNFFDKNGIFSSPTGMLSNLWCLDENKTLTVDELFPLGFGVYK
jgi:hypothetical protein